MATPLLTMRDSPAQGRAAQVQAGIRIEQVTVVWMVIEAVIATGAGIVAHSILLTAFGIDSVIELVTGGMLLWRLTTEARGRSLEHIERAENRAAWVTGIGLVALCLYVVVSAVTDLLMHHQAEGSPAGIGLALVAVIGMPLLARRKRTIATEINSGALRGDAACSITCAYMAGTLLAGLVLTMALGWWWADSVAALGLIYWLHGEAREALEGAKAGRGSCACEDHASPSC